MSNVTDLKPAAKAGGNSAGAVGASVSSTSKPLPIERVFPNPDKAVKNCSIWEMERLLKKRRDATLTFPKERPENWSDYELEQELKRRKKSAAPAKAEKQLKACTDYELEARITAQKKGKATGPKQCHLALIPEDIFVGRILTSFVPNEDCANLVKKRATRPVSRHFHLKEYFCSAHGCRLVENAGNDEQRRTEEEFTDEKDVEDWHHWKDKYPSPNVTTCRPCFMETQGKKACDNCRKWHDWQHYQYDLERGSTCHTCGGGCADCVEECSKCHYNLCTFGDCGIKCDGQECGEWFCDCDECRYECPTCLFKMCYGCMSHHSC